ncbi:MAG: HAD-IC family P-type ATPase, partial [Candidatus Faecousia sp.]|nr:HAD-IC family P-type ATPase [Candidatus Faecousia sp.]
TAGRSEWEIILQNILTFFNLVFIVLAVLLLVGGSSIKNCAFLGVVICNAVIGCVQEIRAKRAVDKLSLLARKPVRVIRDGQRRECQPEELVLGDIVEFGPGDPICADGVVRSGALQLNESLITGEADVISREENGQVKSGSFVVAGRGRVELTAVGSDAFAARLSAEAKADPHAIKSEMMRSLDKLIQVVGILLVPVGLLLFYQEYAVLHLGIRESTEGTVSALVGMIPEGLYLLTSVAMAASALKLSKRKVLVQDMNCIESLARVDVLCVDKTGTITEPKMEVANLIPLTSDPPERLERILAAMYSGREAENDTDRAMSELFGEGSDWVCIQRIPFSSQTKWSGAVFEQEGAYLAGAPEFILGSRFSEVAETVHSWSSMGYRVLLVAAYDGVPEPERLDAERVSPLALVLLTNQIRPQAANTFAYFAQQGVSVRVISGDNPETVSEVAARAGIPNADRYLDATSLQTDEDYLRAVDNCTVFGRVTPDQKKRLVEAFQARGRTVAMTGDGVNDVLAMKQANCSIAMASGAQAASQVASLVLLDSDFAAMPGIVGEGRRVINNIQRAATLFLVKNIFSLALSIISLFTNWPYPLAPLHLSVISALTIGVPSFFLAMEPNYERVRGRFLRGVLRRAFPGGLTNIFVVLAAQAFSDVFAIPTEQISTVCAAILAFVGLLVLYQVCKPFDRFRKLIWGAMAAALVVCFTLLGGLFDLRTGSVGAGLVMATLLIMTPTVFFSMQRLFDWGDKAYLWFRRKLNKPVEP